ncbi:MAG: baseplate J/gp47 family protein [Candidatus Levybacteria bacterium]|nr:baseplate J/gp47 family protein [Candidatus Levybacteria bacterium]
MNLPFFKKKENPEYFLALLLREEKITAVIFEEYLGKIQTIGKHDAFLEKSIEDASIDEWLDVLDKAISEAENSLPENTETKKTVFGVKENWVEESRIKKEYLLKLKKVCDLLGLTPIGFLVIDEAIAHLLQKEEGVPLSAILVEIDNKNVSVSLIKASKIKETKRAKIEDSIPITTDKILHTFTSHEILPSRIIIYNSKDDEKLSQEFIKHSWSKSLPFLHVPQIKTLSKGFDAKAVLFGAATQMGFEILNNNVVEQNPSPALLETIKVPEKEQVIKENPESPEEPGLENFGFIMEKDIAEIPKEEKALSRENPLPENLPEIDEEDLISSSPQSINEENKILELNDKILRDNFLPKKQNKILLLNPSIVFKTAINVLYFIPKILFGIIGILSQHSIKKSKKIILILFAAFLVIVLFLFLYFYILHATITIAVKPKIINKSQTISFSTTSPSDFSKNIIALETISVSKDGTLSIPATGKKEVGDKAKGTVTIYSRLGEEKTFPSGTTITSSNNLEFIFDNSVTIASSSADASSEPKTAKASVTAKVIGKESNLPSSTKFTFGSISQSSIVAKNESAFSGGSKKEINIVSKNDLDKLTTQIPKDLESKAKDEISGKVGSDKTLLPIFIDKSITKKEFSKKAGDEASDVTLTATVSYQGVSFKKNDLNELSKNILQNDNHNMTFTKSGISYDLTDIKIKNEKEISANLKAKAKLLPKLDNKIISGLSGKSFTDAENILLKLPQVSNIDISMSPKIPFLPKILPRISTNISFKVESDE